MNRPFLACAVAIATGCAMIATATAATFPPAMFAVRALTPLLAGSESRANISSLDTQVVKDSEHVVLTIHATLEMKAHCALPSVMVTARVNGVDVEPPFPAFVDEQSDPATGCSASGTFLIDLDAAEYAHPGVFLDQPLHIELTYAS